MSALKFIRCIENTSNIQAVEDMLKTRSAQQLYIGNCIH